jgi:hypothetical protein
MQRETAQDSMQTLVALTHVVPITSAHRALLPKVCRPLLITRLLRRLLIASSIPQNTLISLEDRWTPVLDELRYCKHIYSLKFADRVFPPEPSDFPMDIPSMAEWEATVGSKDR